MRKVFISYRHNAHKNYKEKLLQLNDQYDLFVDKSVDSGEIPDRWSDESIRREIRDRKLKDSTVTLFLHGKNTNKRKFIDWELAGSMIDYNNSYRSAIIIIDLCDRYESSDFKSLNGERTLLSLLSNFPSSPNYKTKAEKRHFWENKLPYAPERIIDNLIKDDVSINIMKWSTFISNPFKLKEWIEKAAEDRKNNKYDTSIKLRRHNS